MGDHTVDPDTGDSSYWRSEVVLDEDGVPIPEYSLPYDWDEVFPLSLVDPAECDFRNSGEMDGALANYNPSTNGLTQYTASNLDGKFQGDILLAGF
ncbi:hypothetical protein HC928_20560 [bacterium]|nr:hypothetical protein [bacterium]